MASFILLLVCVFASLIQFSASLNVHVVCHTHDDVGWLKTVDQYFTGANNSIQHAGVQFILDSVIPALVANPLRKFVYVEQAFFQRWYRQQSASMQATVKNLVANGQLEFINGGWCMHDEAATHYVDMIDQTTLGHRFIMDEFGVRPRIGWQIDPFGHSSTQAALLSAEVGFDALFFGRIDYQDHDLRMKQNNMEFIWAASPSLGSASSIFTGAFQNGNYGPPDSFCFDWFCNDPPIQDDPLLEDVNVQERVDYFVKQSLDAASHTLGNNIMFTMGSDFQFENANEWYKNLDKLIKYVNQDGRINVFYSTPSQYVDAKNAEKSLTFTVKTDDFFPYADGPAQFWSGYFTSRAALKRYVRSTSNLLQNFRQINLLGGGDLTSTTLLEQAQGVAQHHDAVSGTSKQHVAYDYAKRLARGVNTALTSISKVFSTWTSKSSTSSSTQFTPCFLSNVTICDVTTSTNSFIVFSYNPMHRSRSELVSVPVNSTTLQVTDSSGKVIPSQVVSAISNNAKTSLSLPYYLNFIANVPALGFTTFTVEPTHAEDSTDSFAPDDNTYLTIANAFLQVNVSIATGRLDSVTDLKTNSVLSVSQDFLWYASYQFDNVDNNNPSGAYIFRTNGSAPFNIASGPIKSTLVSNGPVVWEIHQVISSWFTQIIRLTTTSTFVEFEYAVGDIPIDDGQGKEIVTRFNTNIATQSLFYTDSNGREFLQRKLNYRPTWNLVQTEPVAGNYFPVNAAAFIQDGKSTFAVLNDRSQGAASLADGQLEFMIHRRTLRDDRRGVGEPMNETESATPYINGNMDRIGKGIVIAGSFYASFNTPSTLYQAIRPLQQRIFSPLFNTFAPLGSSTGADWLSTHTTRASFALTELPTNLELLTLQSWKANTVLLRLAHSFAANEDTTLSSAVTVDLAKLLTPNVKISGVSEVSLTANQPVSLHSKLSWTTTTPVPQAQRGSLSGTLATITPMEIRSFLITLA